MPPPEMKRPLRCVPNVPSTRSKPYDPRAYPSESAGPSRKGTGNSAITSPAGALPYTGEATLRTTSRLPTTTGSSNSKGVVPSASVRGKGPQYTFTPRTPKGARNTLPRMLNRMLPPSPRVSICTPGTHAMTPCRPLRS